MYIPVITSLSRDESVQFVNTCREKINCVHMLGVCVCVCVCVCAHPIKGEGVLEVEGEEGAVERCVLQLAEHAGTQEHGRPRQMKRRARGLLPHQLQ